MTSTTSWIPFKSLWWIREIEKIWPNHCPNSPNCIRMRDCSVLISFNIIHPSNSRKVIMISFHFSLRFQIGTRFFRLLANHFVDVVCSVHCCNMQYFTSDRNQTGKHIRLDVGFAFKKPLLSWIHWIFYFHSHFFFVASGCQ